MSLPLLPNTLTMTVQIVGSVERSYTFVAQANWPPSTTGLVVAADMTTAINTAAASIVNQVVNGSGNIQSLQQQVNNRNFNG